MSEFEAEMQRLVELDDAVRMYLSHLCAAERGSQYDEGPVSHWREQMEILTSGEPFEGVSHERP